MTVHTALDEHKTHQVAELWHMYTYVYTGLNNRLDKEIRSKAKIKLDDYQILAILTNYEYESKPNRVLRMGQISHELNASPSRLTYQIDRLIDRGWVERTEVEQDRRGKAVMITDKGFEQFQNAYTVHSKFVENIISELGGTEEAEKLMEIMRKVQSTIF